MAESAKQKKARLEAEAKARAEQQKLADTTYAQIQAQYGLTDAILSMDTTGSLKDAFEKIRAQKITDPAIAANILAETAWFKEHGVQVTKNLALEQTSPDVFRQNVAAAKEELRDNATRLGKSLSEADLDAIARDAYIYGKAFNSAQVVNEIVARGAATAGGVSGTTALSLKNYAASMGVDMAAPQAGQDWYIAAGDKVAIGDMTEEEFKAQIKDHAKGKYQPFAEQIDKGMTVRQLASPYINSMAGLLEVGADTIGLDDPTIKTALTGLNKDNQPALKSLWQFETDLRKDPRWATTKNANDTVNATARNILQTFGLVS